MSSTSCFVPTLLFLGLDLVLASTSASAQSPSATLVKDVNASAAAVASSAPSVIHNSGAIIYVAATSRAAGSELYRTLGSAGGITLVKDINPGRGNSYPNSFITVNGTTYFGACDGVNGHELWKTDGTAPGTVMVKDIVPGPGSATPSSMVAIGNTLYFMLGGAGEREVKAGGSGSGDLWKSDGTANGTVLVKKFSSGSASSANRFAAASVTPSLYVAGNMLYIIADDGQVGSELWKSDGTTNGTVLVKDIYPGNAANGTANSSLIQYFTVFNGKGYFRANDGVNGNELWVTDGTANGTMLLKDIRAGTTAGNPSYLTVFGNYIYFSANNGSGNELWRSDGTANGTNLFVDINTTTATASSSPYNNDPNTAVDTFAVMGNAFYFRAQDGSNGLELYKCDGTVNGTALVKDIRAGSGGSSPTNIVSDGQKTIYFSANDGTGAELWKSDGTANGTVLVKDINTTAATASSSPSLIAPALLGGIVFRANDGTTGIEPWFSDGTAKGTKILADLNQPVAGDSGNSSPSYLTDANGTLFFVANDGTTGNELWKTDGTASGTALVKDISPGTGSSSPAMLVEMHGNVYFRANDGINGLELWKSDGTANGTVMVKDIRSGNPGSSPSYLTYDGFNTVYFSANDGSGNELWKTDGTANGTVLIKDINTTTANASSSPSILTMMNGVAYFRANDGSTGNELWKSDGTTSGTVLVKDINPGTAASTPNNLAFDGVATIYFSANNGSGNELWKTDGTANGTVLIKDINTTTTTAHSTPDFITPLGNKVLFAADDGVNGDELWVSDGTTAGTMMVKDLWTGNTSGRPNSSSPSNISGGDGGTRQFARLGNALYFAANSDVGTASGGIELWKTDGTANGTVVAANINVAGDSRPTYITTVGSRHLFFQAADHTPQTGMGTGTEVWMSDGTATGTKRLTDLNPADNNSAPIYFTLSGGKLFFRADDGAKGIEVWMLDPGATSQSIGHGCPAIGMPTFSATDPVLGGSITVASKGAAGRPLLALLVGLKNNPLTTSIGFGCHLYVDPAKSPILLFFIPANDGSWKLTSNLPNSTAAVGTEVMLQVGYGPGGTLPLGVDLSPGMKLTLGY